MDGKRKHEELALHYDAKLTAVTNALRNIARVDESKDITCGAFSEYPLPGLRLDGDVGYLPLPLTPREAETIVQKTANDTSDKLTWEIQREDIHMRNQRWETFIKRIVGAIREPLAISRAASVEAKLNKLMLVCQGGLFPVDTATHSVSNSVFGTLVVVLPGDFTSKEVDVGDLSADAGLLQWGPRSKDAYDITYTAFYNGNCSDKFRSMLVTSGVMLCLVYDLVTSTIHEVPRLAGEAGLQRALEASLTHFFEVLPPHKRFKISDDSWHTINEFAVDHRFVYPVTGESFASLSSGEQRVADRLAAFCKHSNGQYVLYLAGLRCVRKVYPSEDDTRVTFKAVLESPWYKHGEFIGADFPSTVVNDELELAPTGVLETAEFATDDESGHDDDDDDAYLFHYHSLKTRRHHCFALVVLAATVEQTLWAKMPITGAIAKIQEFIHTQPEKASGLARRVIAVDRSAITQAVFSQLLAIVRELDDAPLFDDLLAGVKSFEFDNGSLSIAVRHFGWDACITKIERIIETTNFRGCVNLICSVLHGSTCCNRIQHLIRLLIEVQPWLGNRDPFSSSQPYYDGLSRASRNPNPTIEELSRIFALAYQASIDTLMQLIDKTTFGSLEHTHIIPSLARFVGELPTSDRSPFVPTLRKMYESTESSLPRLRNASYAAYTILNHCDRCCELQAFLSAPAPQIELRLRSKAHIKHMEAVIKRVVPATGMISVTHTPPDIVLTKVSMTNEHSMAAEQCLASLASLITQ